MVMRNDCSVIAESIFAIIQKYTKTLNFCERGIKMLEIFHSKNCLPVVETLSGTSQCGLFNNPRLCRSLLICFILPVLRSCCRFSQGYAQFAVLSL